MGCSYNNRLRAKFDDPVKLRQKMKALLLRDVYDVEDLVHVGNNCGVVFVQNYEFLQVFSFHFLKICPYFASTKVLLRDAAIVFCPYNYLIGII